MSNARNLANLLGTNTTIQAAKLADDAVTSAKLPAGSVLQVKTGVYSTQTNISTAGAYEDTGLSLSITPTSTSSKILIVYAMHFRINSNSSDVGMAFRVVRGSTAIDTPVTSYDNYSYDGGGRTDNRTSDTKFYLDSPATTSAVTYKIQMISYSESGAETRTQSDGNKSRIMLMEIAA